MYIKLYCIYINVDWIITQLLLLLLVFCLSIKIDYAVLFCKDSDHLTSHPDNRIYTKVKKPIWCKEIMQIVN